MVVKYADGNAVCLDNFAITCGNFRFESHKNVLEFIFSMDPDAFFIRAYRHFEDLFFVNWEQLLKALRSRFLAIGPGEHFQ